MRQFACLVFSFLVAVSGCATFSPLPPGRFSGTGECVFIITEASGSKSTKTFTTNPKSTINNRGIPLSKGEEISVGRTVLGEMGQYTCTRIEATANGLVIHGTMSINTGVVSASGEIIAVMSTFETSKIQVEQTGSMTASNGQSVDIECISIQSPSKGEVGDTLDLP